MTLDEIETKIDELFEKAMADPDRSIDIMIERAILELHRVELRARGQDNPKWARLRIEAQKRYEALLDRKWIPVLQRCYDAVSDRKRLLSELESQLR